MIDIDTALATLRDDPLPPGLDTIDTGVMREIVRDAARPIGTGIGLLAVVMAAGLGMAGASEGPPPARRVVPFGLDGARAPSLLLGEAM